MSKTPPFEPDEDLIVGIEERRGPSPQMPAWLIALSAFIGGILGSLIGVLLGD